MLGILDVDIPWEGLDNGGDNFFGLILQLVILLYCFLGLAIVCDDHLVPALDTLCHRCNIPEDVAGATFMAFGSAAPEIIINCIATLQTLTSSSTDSHQTSLGVSAILGSGMIAFSLIPAACGLASSKDLQLKRRPLARDEFFYGVSLIILICIIYKGEASVFLCSLLLINYIIYLFVIVFASSIRKYLWTHYYKLDFDNRPSVVARKKQVTEKTPLIQKEPDLEEQPDNRLPCINRSDEEALASITDAGGYGSTGHASDEEVQNWDKGRQESARDMDLAFQTLSQESITEKGSGPPPLEWRRSLSNAGLDELIPHFEKNKYTNPELWERLTHKDFETMGLHAGTMAKFRRFMNQPEFQRGTSILNLEKNLDEDTHYESDDHEAHSGLGRIIHLAAVPLEFAFEWTCPDCEIGAKYEKLYLVTFGAAFLWVTIFSFVLSSVIERWVNISGVPMTFFGLLLVSLGAEIPDTIESVTVAKRGYGSMAVSNCQGTQVINICLGLGLPWLIVVSTGQQIRLETGGLLPPAFIQCVVLCFNVFVLLGVTMISGRDKAILNKRVAMYLVSAYVCAIMTFAIYLVSTGQLFGGGASQSVQ